MHDTISLSPATTNAFNRLGLGDFTGVESCERMAFVVLVLIHLKDRQEWFPKGKWATIQHIQNGLDAYAEETAMARNLQPA